MEAQSKEKEHNIYTNYYSLLINAFLNIPQNEENQDNLNKLSTTLGRLGFKTSVLSTNVEKNNILEEISKLKERVDKEEVKEKRNFLLFFISSLGELKGPQFNFKMSNYDASNSESTTLLLDNLLDKLKEINFLHILFIYVGCNFQCLLPINQLTILKSLEKNEQLSSILANNSFRDTFHVIYKKETNGAKVQNFLQYLNKALDGDLLSKGKGNYVTSYQLFKYLSAQEKGNQYFYDQLSIIEILIRWNANSLF
jgi:hypothetical protein